jgi:hypothetical protein
VQRNNNNNKKNKKKYMKRAQFHAITAALLHKQSTFCTSKASKLRVPAAHTLCFQHSCTLHLLLLFKKNENTNNRNTCSAHSLLPTQLPSASDSSLNIASVPTCANAMFLNKEKKRRAATTTAALSCPSHHSTSPACPPVLALLRLY